MSDLVGRCVRNRVLWSARIVLGIAAPVAVLFAVVGLLAGGLTWTESLLVLLAGFGAAVLVSPVLLYHPWRFVRMLRRQEEALGITLGEEDFTSADPKASRLNQHYHFSGNWYMCEGSWALHRLYIVKVTQKSARYNYGRVYSAHVETADGKTYKLRMESASDLKRFCRWYKGECP